MHTEDKILGAIVASMVLCLVGPLVLDALKGHAVVQAQPPKPTVQEQLRELEVQVDALERRVALLEGRRKP